MKLYERNSVMPNDCDVYPGIQRVSYVGAFEKKEEFPVMK